VHRNSLSLGVPSVQQQQQSLATLADAVNPQCWQGRLMQVCLCKGGTIRTMELGLPGVITCLAGLWLGHLQHW